jgi:hypothetical protein
MQAPPNRETRVESICWVIQPWSPKTVARELRSRGLNPVLDNESNGFESFHVQDPNGFDVQIANDGCLAKGRRTRNPAQRGPKFSMIRL